MVETRKNKRNLGDMSFSPLNENVIAISPPKKRRGALSICFKKDPNGPPLVSPLSQSDNPKLFDLPDLLPRIRSLARDGKSFLVASGHRQNLEGTENCYKKEKIFCQKLMRMVHDRNEETSAAVNKFLQMNEWVVDHITKVEKEWKCAVSDVKKFIRVSESTNTEMIRNGLFFDFQLGRLRNSVMKGNSRVLQTTAGLKFELQKRMDLLRNDESGEASDEDVECEVLCMDE